MTAPRLGGGLRLVGWISGLTASVVLLVRLGHGQLGAPPLTSGRVGLAQWLATRDPATLLMCGIRLVALAIAMYLLAATVLAVVARASRAAALISLSDHITVPVVRRIVGRTIGVAIAIGPLIGPDPGWALSPTPPVATAAYAPGPAVSVVDRPPTPEPPDPPVLRRLPEDAAPPVTVPAQAPATAPPPSAPAPSSPAPSSPAPSSLAPSSPVPPSPAPSSPVPPSPAPSSPAAAPPLTPTRAPQLPQPTPAVPGVEPAPVASPVTDSWTVRPGDHLWLIAASTLAAARQRPVSDDEVAPYWELVVRVNRPGLPDPANADLLYAGMRIALPPVP